MQPSPLFMASWQMPDRPAWHLIMPWYRRARSRVSSQPTGRPSGTLIPKAQDARKKGARIIDIGATDTQRAHTLGIFSDHQSTVAHVLARTTSGNVTVNDTLPHYVVDDLPFGGVGPSGMGAYHGEEGFKSLSHVKGVFTQARLNFAGARALWSDDRFRARLSAPVTNQNHSHK